MTARIAKYDIWSSSPNELGLSEEQWEAESKWMQEFNDTTDALDWEQWKDFWSEDAFFKFANYPQIHGKEKIGEFFRQHFAKYKMMQHQGTRHTYDIPRGVVYQGLEVSSVVKEDPEERVVTVPALNAIYKRPGETQIRGLEIFTDPSPMVNLYEEVMSKLGK